MHTEVLGLQHVLFAIGFQLKEHKREQTKPASLSSSHLIRLMKMLVLSVMKGWRTRLLFPSLVLYSLANWEEMLSQSTVPHRTP